MSSNPTTTYASPTYEPPPSNGLGVAGFVVSLTGLVVCGGFACPVGLALSLIALRKAPRGLAVGGVVLGVIGSALATLFALVVFGVIGAGWSFMNAFGGMHWQTQQAMWDATTDIDQHYTANNNTLPDDATGSALISHRLDEWNTPLRYRLDQQTSPVAQDYVLISAGPDQQFGTQDDIEQPQLIFGGFGPGGALGTQPNTGIGLDQSTPNAAQVDFAFEQAATALNQAFQPGSELPAAEIGGPAIAGYLDAWGEPIRYKPTDNPPMYHLQSAGPDSQWNTADDDVRTFFFDPNAE